MEKENQVPSNPFQVTIIPTVEENISKALGISDERSDLLFNHIRTFLVDAVFKPEGAKSHTDNFTKITRDCQSTNEVAFVVFMYTKMFADIEKLAEDPTHLLKTLVGFIKDRQE